MISLRYQTNSHVIIFPNSQIPEYVSPGNEKAIQAEPGPLFEYDQKFNYSPAFSSLVSVCFSGAAAVASDFFLPPARLVFLPASFASPLPFP
jgi:hypothetical protein